MIFLIVLSCFWLSGFAALLYQIAWMRQFSIAFGTSEISVVVVLAGYMAGLALGAALAGRYIKRAKSPVLVYGLLEGAIAIAAISMPLMIVLVGNLYELVVGGQPAPPDATGFGQTLFYVTASIALLIIPTALMGATLPLLAQYAVRKDKQLGSRISALYSVNTLGAVVGTVTAGFFLLPKFGLTATVWVGVLVNFVIFLLACFISKSKIIDKQEDEKTVVNHQDSEKRTISSFILPIMLLSGSLSFVYEVLWTRLLSHVLGSSIYAFSTMLAAFLTGIALGAGMAAGVAQNKQRALYALALVQFGIAICSAAVYIFLQGWQPGYQVHPSVAFAVILPSALFIGASYPLAVRALSSGPDQAGQVSAQVYAWNTVGAIIGALAAGFVIIPNLGFADSAKLVTLANVLLGVIILVIWYKTSTKKINWNSVVFWLKTSPALIALLFLTIWFQPQRPDTLVMRAIFGGSGTTENQEIYYAVGRSSTVLMSENLFRFDLSTNGLPEAQIEFAGAPPAILSQRWLGMWPSLARPDTSNMLVVGLGGGVVLEGVPSTVDQIDVIELEPEVLAANQTIADKRIIDRLSDDRFNIVINDARNALRLSSKTYDAIVSQPSHPWTAGASHLFTQEFFQLVHSRLNEGGVFVQWMNAEFLDAELSTKLIATLNETFKYVRVYQPTPFALHFLASDEELNLEEAIIESGAPLRDDPQHYAVNGIASTLDVLSKLVLDEEGSRAYSEGAQIITDNFNSMATDSRPLADGLNLRDLSELTREFDPLLNNTNSLRQLIDGQSLAYMVWYWLSSGYVNRVADIISTIEDQDSRHLIEAIIHRYQGRENQMWTSLDAIPPQSPLFETALFMRIENNFDQLSSGQLSLSNYTNLDISAGTLYWIVEGVKLVAAQDWQGLYEIESRLASVPTNSLWRSYALHLRAIWRSQANDPEGVLHSQSLALIDRAIVQNRNESMLLVRAGLGEAFSDQALFVESIVPSVLSLQYDLINYRANGLNISNEEGYAVLDKLYNFQSALTLLTENETNDRTETISNLISSMISYLENSTQ